MHLPSNVFYDNQSIKSASIENNTTHDGNFCIFQIILIESCFVIYYNEKTN